MSSGADAFVAAVDALIAAHEARAAAACDNDGPAWIAAGKDARAARAALLAAHAAAVAEARNDGWYAGLDEGRVQGRAAALREVDEACTAIDLSAPARGVSLVFPPSGPRAGQWVCWGQPGDKASDATPTAAILRLAAALRAEAQP